MVSDKIDKAYQLISLCRVDFVNQYCFVHGTYFVPMDEQLSFDEEERKKVTIQYYQWVPYILALQAFLFYVPRFVWKSLLAYSGEFVTVIRFARQIWCTL